MKITLNTKQLEVALKRVELIIDRRKQVEIVHKTKLQAENNELQIISTDIDNFLICRVDATIQKEGSTVIDIKELLKSFRFMKNSTTNLEMEGDKLKISNGNKDIKLDTIDIKDYVKTPKVEDIKHKYNYKTNLLFNRLKKVDYAKAKDDTRPTLTGTIFKGSDIVTLDGYRLALSEDTKLETKDPFVLPPRASNFILKTTKKSQEKDITISTNDRFIVLEYDDMKLISRKIEGQIFDYKKVIGSKGDDTIKLNTKKTTDDLAFLNVYTDKKDNDMTGLTIDNSVAEFKVNNEKGIFKTEQDIQSDFKLEIYFNNKYILDALKHTEKEDVEISFKGRLNPIVLHDDKDIHLVLPIRKAS